ncbi:universal stress protein [Natronorubrum texcoconense]|uniref:Nucleotide-binding universal stress protein, UspA family n=1 Tax=Natronorubrum texcoconense TaxID=1095776 RepID=A0A1G9H0N8_9EURY|nr:universal stress protein [Natronorubrum texcoconense]SDL06404.1 Nucleotide-binding universal stress protein, UspA family [Natronorubrum texcoconense]
MYTVLLPVKSDRSLEAADYVTALPDSESTVEVVLLSVFEEFEAADEAGVVRSSDLYDETDLPAHVVEVAQVLEERGIAVTVRREHGDPTAEIVRIAREVDADTIAMAGRDRSATGKVLFGSVIQGVILESDRPVTVLRRE